VTPVQKLIWPATTAAFLQQGSSLLAGPVVRIADAMGWRTPADVLTAYGLDATGVASVDVLRFKPTPLSHVSIPQPGDATATAGYERGFLPGSAAGPVPVWDLAPTTVARDAELWRIHADGKQELLSAYAGPAFGWRGTAVFVPPTAMLGPRAVWQGTEYTASWVDPQHIELVMISQEPVDGFEQTRPFIFRRVADAASCDRVFEMSFTAMWNDITCTLIQSNDREAAVLLHCDPQTAAAVGAVVLEPGVFWHLVPRTEVTLIQGLSRELPA